MKNFNNWIWAVLNAAQYVAAAMSINETLQTINLICAVLSTIIITVFAVIRWWNSAKQDGKLDDKEIEELREIIAQYNCNMSNVVHLVEKSYSAAPPEETIDIVEVDQNGKKM